MLENAVTLLILFSFCFFSSTAHNSADLGGWKMTDRFTGFRFELPRQGKMNLKERIQEQADSLFCFGWVQDSALRDTVVGEARCKKHLGYEMIKFLDGLNKKEKSCSTREESSQESNEAIIKEYKDTKIKLHFTHFKILDKRRVTCFLDKPHKCEDPMPLW